MENGKLDEIRWFEAFRMSHYDRYEVNESEPTPIERSKSLRHAYAWKQNAYRTTTSVMPSKELKALNFAREH